MLFLGLTLICLSIILVFIMGVKKQEPKLWLICISITIGAIALHDGTIAVTSDRVVDNIANDRVYVAREYTITETGDTIAVKGRLIKH